ncbi:hypothetical protein [Thiosocius teredinicola]|uniref:hypothetical protein n=1 Tax=Thiosocius teredinicola TaxID=1973002 RepID=UPI000991071A
MARLVGFFVFWGGVIASVDDLSAWSVLFALAGAAMWFNLKPTFRPLGIALMVWAVVDGFTIELGVMNFFGFLIGLVLSGYVDGDIDDQDEQFPFIR